MFISDQGLRTLEETSENSHSYVSIYVYKMLTNHRFLKTKIRLCLKDSLESLLRGACLNLRCGGQFTKLARDLNYEVTNPNIEFYFSNIVNMVLSKKETYISIQRFKFLNIIYKKLMTNIFHIW